MRLIWKPRLAMTMMMYMMLLVMPLLVPMLLTTLVIICLVMRSTAAFSTGIEPSFRRRAGKPLYPWIGIKLAAKAMMQTQMFTPGTL
jgi:hypothetical protein